ncbi:MAG: PcfB family protein [Firmicutes bacterium]|nr:PcfB family protein [Bacillota bacterium]
MLEEQGRGVLKNGATKFFGWMFSVLKKSYVHIRDKSNQNKAESGKKSVKELVRKGRDLELTEYIQEKDKLKDICKQLKKQGIAFAVKKEKDGAYKVLYQRKDATLVNGAIENAYMKELKQKPSLKEILKRNKQLVEENKIDAPLKHKEIGAR